MRRFPFRTGQVVFPTAPEPSFSTLPQSCLKLPRSPFGQRPHSFQLGKKSLPFQSPRRAVRPAPSSSPLPAPPYGAPDGSIRRLTAWSRTAEKKRAEKNGKVWQRVQRHSLVLTLITPFEWFSNRGYGLGLNKRPLTGFGLPPPVSGGWNSGATTTKTGFQTVVSTIG